jgi:hypothetical protein
MARVFIHSEAGTYEYYDTLHDHTLISEWLIVMHNRFCSTKGYESDTKLQPPRVAETG